MRLVAISGKAGSGKDTVAAMLNDIDGRGFLEIAFGDTIKRVASTLTGIELASWYDRDFKETFNERLGCKPRQYMQHLGDTLRSFDEDVFIKACFNRMSGAGSYIVTDVRRLNEAEACKKFGAFMLRVDRPGLDSGEHISETDLDDWKGWDAVIVNDGDLDDLRRKVVNCVIENFGKDFE